jgi:hypothetical protein
MVGCLVTLGACLSQGTAHAQRFNTGNYTPYSVNPYYNPYTAYAQRLSRQTMGAAQSMNNQVMWQSGSGFGPFPGTYGGRNGYGGFGGGYGGYGYGGYGYGGYGYGGYNPIAAAYSPLTNPYVAQSTAISASLAASSAYGGDGLNPYNTNPYDPYGYGSYGQTLKGAADLARSFGNLSTSFEQARLMREQYNQAQLDTKKKAFDLDMYIKQNTPTYTEEQARVARLTLKRIQTNSAPGEVASGKAINFLLDDLRKYPNKKTLVEPIPITEEILNRLNVSKNTYGLGMLRDDGKFAWPLALQDLLTITQRDNLDKRIRGMVQDANKGKLDGNVLKDVRFEIDKVGDELVKKINDIPSSQYLDAKRFLQEFHEATIALERGEAPVQSKFQRFTEGGKTVQEVADYMITNGLRFSSATAGDEATYRAFYTILASYDVNLNAQLGTAFNKDQ